ncbi:MAG: alpha/beta fold hydrolase [Ignavibacteriae bacterium]|nr:alpha/beta fold hydrolase [Ignavibacteriota bacterium]MCB9215440.1 alpha/beta fold hydrolase [Ignavibacteria bacterium]
MFPHRQLLLTTLLLILSPLLLPAQTIGPSWKDIGTQMIGAGKLDSAQFYLERWVEADPGDEGSWYNLSCVYALQGEKESALNAWEMSVAAGWDDAEHPLRDSDLESIRSDPRFTTALEKINSRLEQNAPKDYIRNFLETKTVGTYVVLLPEDYEKSNRSYPLCIILHGSGSTELGHGRLADRFGRDGVIYVVPRAPYTHSSAHKSSGNLGFTAWPLEKIDSLDPLYNQVGPMYAEWIMNCAEDVRNRYRVSNDKVTILGHSQGAAFSFITAALYPAHVRSIFAYAGYFPEEYRTAERLAALKENGVEITLAHGIVDNVVDPEESRRLDSTLSESGIPHTLTLYEETGHAILPDVMEQMKDWVEKVARREK